METLQSNAATALPISVRPLRESDLSEADRVMRLAFGTFIGLPEPLDFMGDAGFVHTRWRTDPAAAFGAEAGGELVGSNFATNWGSVGFFGPLTIRPDFWDRGVGKQLLEPVMACFERWETRHAGLFTFPHSQKHVGLYQKFGFWPRYLTCLMSRPVQATGRSPGWEKFSEVAEDRRDAVIGACRQITDSIYDGLDVGQEIRAVAAQGLGDTVLLWDDDRMVGLAVGHCGPGSEAGSGTCHLKFGAVLPGEAGERNFGRLLAACEEMAGELGAQRMTGGVNTARHEAYRQMLARGFRTDVQGVAMQKSNEAGYNREGVYLIDDWR